MLFLIHSQLFDIIVVVVSFFLEALLEFVLFLLSVALILAYREEDAVESGFLIILRLWRITRIINGECRHA